MVEHPTVQSKVCSKCHVEKQAGEFDRYKRTADGLQSQCKVCMKVTTPRTDTIVASSGTDSLWPVRLKHLCLACRQLAHWYQSQP